MASKWTAALLVLWLAAAAVLAQEDQTTTGEIEQTASNAVDHVKDDANSFSSWVSSQFGGSSPPNPQGDEKLSESEAISTSRGLSDNSFDKAKYADDVSDKDSSDRVSRGLSDNSFDKAKYADDVSDKDSSDRVSRGLSDNSFDKAKYADDVSDRVSRELSDNSFDKAKYADEVSDKDSRDTPYNEHKDSSDRVSRGLSDNSFDKAKYADDVSDRVSRGLSDNSFDKAKYADEVSDKDSSDRVSRGLSDNSFDKAKYADEVSDKDSRDTPYNEPKLAVLNKISGRSLLWVQIMTNDGDNKDDMKDKPANVYEDPLDEAGQMMDVVASDNTDKMIKDTTTDKAWEMMVISTDLDEQRNIVSDKVGEMTDANTDYANQMTDAHADKYSETMDAANDETTTSHNLVEEDVEGKTSDNEKHTTTNVEHELRMEKINEAMDRAARMIHGGIRTTAKDNEVIRMATDKASNAKMAMAEWKQRAFNKYKNAKGKVKEAAIKQRV